MNWEEDSETFRLKCKRRWKREAGIWKEQWKMVPWWNRRAWKRRREITTQSSASLLMQGTFGKGERDDGVREGGRCGEGIEIVRPGFKHTAILQRMMNWIQMQFSCWKKKYTPYWRNQTNAQIERRHSCESVIPKSTFERQQQQQQQTANANVTHKTSSKAFGLKWLASINSLNL